MATQAMLAQLKVADDTNGDALFFALDYLKVCYKVQGRMTPKLLNITEELIC